MSKTYEQKRIDKLNGFNLLDTLPEKEFDELVKLCTLICETPVALISLVDEKRQWFKACLGLGISQTSRNIAFCDYTIRMRDTFVVEDTTRDDRFKENPLVTGEPHIRFYAGTPLWTHDGYCIGSLCVIDTKPRTLSVVQKDAMEVLARQVMITVEKRTFQAESALDRLQAKNAQQRLLDSTRSMNAGLYMTDQDGKCTFVNDAWCRLHGLAREEALGYGYMSLILEDDRIELLESGLKAREQQTSIKAQIRVKRPDGIIRHMEVISEPDGNNGRIGTVYDVTQHIKRIEALEKELLEYRAPMLKKA